MRRAVRLKRVLSQPPASLLLLAEAVFFLAWARLLVLLPFSSVSRSLRLLPMQDTAFSAPWADERDIRRLSRFLHAASRHVCWECKCLVRALAAVRMLARRGIDSTLYLGTAKGDGGGLIAHAWVRCGSVYVTGAEEMGRFTTVGKFAKFAHHHSKPEGVHHG